MPGTWILPTHQLAFGAGTMLLLTNGTVICHSSSARQWWNLTPSINRKLRQRNRVFAFKRSERTRRCHFAPRSRKTAALLWERASKVPQPHLYLLAV
jgi:hypothetical protein